MATAPKIADLLRMHGDFLASEYGVKRIGLFGSHAKGRASEASDVDLVVEFARPIGFLFAELAEYLESLVGRRGDILTPAGIQWIRVPGIAKSIEESTVCVWASGQ